MDLKYITRQDESSINSNVFQMLAYLVANKTKHGILLYAGGSERLDKIKNSGFIICQWSLNLERGLNSEQIEIRIEGVVEEVVGILKR